MISDAFVPTSVARRMIVRMRATHERRRISIFSGPPGIGKTTAVDAFQGHHPDAAAVVKIARRPAKEVLALQHALEAIRRLAALPGLHTPSSVWHLRNDLFGAICHWAGAEPIQARHVGRGVSGRWNGCSVDTAAWRRRNRYACSRCGVVAVGCRQHRGETLLALLLSGDAKNGGLAPGLDIRVCAESRRSHIPGDGQRA